MPAETLPASGGPSVVTRNSVVTPHLLIVAFVGTAYDSRRELWSGRIRLHKSKNLLEPVGKFVEVVRRFHRTAVRTDERSKDLIRVDAGSLERVVGVRRVVGAHQRVRRDRQSSLRCGG